MGALPHIYDGGQRFSDSEGTGQSLNGIWETVRPYLYQILYNEPFFSLKICAYLQSELSIPEDICVLQRIALSSLAPVKLSPLNLALLKSQSSHLFSAINFFKLISSNDQAELDTANRQDK